MDGLVYGTCHNVIFALNARTGAFIWSQSAPSHQIFNSPVAIDGKVYLTSSWGIS
jgi:outer membrane protein assembly factor BamB